MKQSQLIFILIKKKRNMIYVMKHVEHVIIKEMQLLIIVLHVILIVFLDLKKTQQIVSKNVDIDIILHLMDNTNVLKIKNVQVLQVFILNIKINVLVIVV